jgi:hypothetical protein
MRKGLGRAREIGVISGVPSIAAATISVPTRVSGCHRVAYINPIVSYPLKTGPCHPEFPLSNGPYPPGASRCPERGSRRAPNRARSYLMRPRESSVTVVSALSPRVTPTCRATS